MEYSLKAEKDKKYLRVQDVVSSEENLRGGLNEVVGKNVDEKITWRQFFKFLRRSMSKGTLLLFEEKNGRFSFEWIDRKEKTVRRAELDSSSHLEISFLKKLKHYKAFFDKEGFFIQRRAVRKGCRSGVKSLKQCIDIITFHNKKGVMAKDTNYDRAAQIYDILDHYSALIKYLPVAKPTSFKIVEKALGLIFGIASSLMLALCLLPVLTHEFVFGMIFVPCSILLMSFPSMIVDYSFGCLIDKSAMNIKEELEEKYGQQIMKGKNRKPGLIDWIDRDIAFLKQSSDKIVDEFEQVAIDYSMAVNRQLKDSTDIVDRYSYCNWLLDIEAATFLKGAGNGFKKKLSFIDDKRLLEMLEFLGWDEKFGISGFVTRMCELIRDVRYMNYEGCEVEICSIIKLTLRGIVVMDSEDVDALRELLDEERLVIEEASRKKLMAADYEKENCSLQREVQLDKIATTLETGRSLPFKPIDKK